MSALLAWKSKREAVLNDSASLLSHCSAELDSFLLRNRDRNHPSIAALTLTMQGEDAVTICWEADDAAGQVFELNLTCFDGEASTSSH